MRSEVPVWNPFRGGYSENPSDQLRELRERNPVHKGVNGRWIVLRYDDVKRVLSSPEFITVKFSSELASKSRFLADGEDLDAISSVAEKWFLFFDPPQHTEIRGMASRIWNKQKIAGEIERITEECLNKLSGRSGAELIRDFAVYIPTCVVCAILGLPPEDHQKFKVWSYSFNSVFEPFATLHDLKDYNTSAAEFFSYMETVLEQKRLSPDDGFISSLIVENDLSEAPLRDSQLISVIAFMFFAGIETSVNLFGQAVYYLSSRPDQVEHLLSAEVSIPRAVDEILRFVSPNQYTTRVAGEVIELGGQLIKKGDFIMGSTASANRDPEVFDDPENIDLTRAKNPHLSFGYGLHYCMGARLARDEISVSLPAFFRKFPNVRLDPNSRHEWDKIILNRGLRTLPVILAASVS